LGTATITGGARFRQEATARGADRERRRTLPLTRDAHLGLLRRELTRLIDEGGDL
jgi:hypothetical protein